MNGRLLIFMILLIGLMISGCEKSGVLEDDFTTKKTVTKANDLIAFTLVIEGQGNVEVSSPSIGTKRVQTTTTFYVKERESILLKALGENFLGWADNSISQMEYVYEVLTNSSFYANFSVPVNVKVVGPGKLFIDFDEVNQNSPYHADLVKGNTIHITVDNNGCDLSQLTLNGSDISTEVPGDFTVGNSSIEIMAEFVVFTRYLVIEENSSVSKSNYEIRLDGYECRDGHNLSSFSYDGGNYTCDNYVQNLGMNGSIENTGSKTLYVRADFDGDIQNFTIYPKSFQSLGFISYSYAEYEWLNLNISISDKRY